MDRVLDHPSTDLDRSDEEMLRDLENLNDAVLRELETARPEAQRRYETELLPLLEDARTLVAQTGIRARNALEDAVLRFRAFVASSARPNLVSRGSRG